MQFNLIQEIEGYETRMLFEMKNAIQKLKTMITGNKLIFDVLHPDFCYTLLCFF